MTVSNQTIDSFMDELEALCRQYGLSIAHEDAAGAFKIERLSEENILYLRSARRPALYQNK